MQKKVLIISLIINVLGLLSVAFAINRVGGIGYILSKLKNKGLPAMYYQRIEHLATLMDTSNEIVFLGNSITAAAEWAELLENPKVRNRGIPGDMTDGVLRRLPDILDSKPDKIFLMIGINDLLQFSNNTIIENYRLIIQKIKQDSPSTNIYIQSILPVNNEVFQTGLSNEDVLYLNQNILEIANKNNLPYIDLYDALKDDKGRLDKKYTGDGVHLNGSAYLVWKKIVAPYVNN